MRFVHISDTHLGFKTYHYVDKETGLNQREVDNYQAFEKAIDKIIELKPKFVLHSGDLFNTVSPSNFSLNFAIEQLKRLVNSDIKVVILAGNHSTPKVKEQSHIFKIFRHFEGIYPLYKGEYECLDFDQIQIHAISQSINEESFQKEISKVNKLKFSLKKFHVLLLHGAVKSLKEFSMSEFNELSIPMSILKKDFSYIALGHYHNQTKILNNCYYSGALIPLTFGEIDDKKGFLLTNLKTKTVKSINIESRPLINLPVIDAALKTSETLEKALQLNLAKCKNGCICRQKINNIDDEIFASLNSQHLKKAGKNCLHYQLLPIRQNAKEDENQSTTIGNLQEEFIHFLKRKKVTQNDNLTKKGLAYLNKAYETD